MRISYISQGNIPSKWAHSFQAMRMAEAFAKKAKKFYLLTNGSVSCNGDTVDINEWYGISRPFRIKKLPVYRKLNGPLIEGFRYPRFDKAAAIYSRLTSPDLVFTRSILAGCWSAALGLKTIVETHVECDHPEFKRITACRSKNLIGIVTITEDLKRLYVEAGIPAQKILVWPDGVNLDPYGALPSKEALRTKLNLPHDQFIAVYSGHLYPEKGIDTILAAAQQLSDVQFLLVGGWEKDIDAYKKRAAQMHLNNVTFAGFVPNKAVPEYLGAADCLLMPNSAKSSHSWMSPLKLFEYMAAQRPIISSDLPALRTYLSVGRNAILIKPDDAQALVSAITSIRSGNAPVELLVHQAYKDAHGYTWDKRVEDILNFYFKNGSRK